ncbi:MAG: low molecular weight phosphatase family protein [Pseudonocardiales bacterium]|nr:low molecular weight phosphatase family protein [Pseudonocardiales bacterium]
MAERVLLRRLADQNLTDTFDISVTSAGTYGMVGQPMDGSSALALRELGVNPDDHIARQLDNAMLNNANLILTATTEHLNSRLGFGPRVMPRAFTMKEFAVLCSQAAPGHMADGVSSTEYLRDRVGYLDSKRGLSRAQSPFDLNIEDPYGRGYGAARACAAEISRVVNLGLTALGLTVNSETTVV